ncbi:MAG: DUF2500 domain-containing protein [Lachnospiraceae bacterium]|nr:DUF2500 domain-containing protein [Lachnospiraceae bacterium]
MQNMFVGAGIFGIIVMVISVIMCLLSFGVFIFLVVRIIKNAKKDDNSPKITVPATVVTKRSLVRHASDMGSTRYFVTFELENRERMELSVSGNESGMLVEGDYGMLTFQGTRFVDFERR